LQEFFEGVEGLLKTGPADEVSYHVQYSKSALKDVIKKYPGKEVFHPSQHLDQKES
jgi:exocyst complex component 1